MGRQHRLDWEPERARLRDKQAPAELGADLLPSRAQAGLDAPARRVLLDGGAIRYDALVIAIGVRPRSLLGPSPVGMHLLRTLDNALTLRAQPQAGPRVVVVVGTVPSSSDQYDTKIQGYSAFPPHAEFQIMSRDPDDRRFTTAYGHHGTSCRHPGRSQRRSGGLTHERLRGSFAVERAVPEVRAFRAARCLSQITRRQPPWLRSRVQRDAIECER